MELPSWFELADAQGCPFCPPRPDTTDYLYFVCRLSVSSLYLARNQAYQGTCALIYDPSHVTGPVNSLLTNGNSSAPMRG